MEHFQIVVQVVGAISAIFTIVLGINKWHQGGESASLFSSWMIPWAVKKDKELEEFQHRLSDVEGREDTLREVAIDRRRRMERVWSREIRGEELSTSVLLITALAVVILYVASFVMSYLSPPVGAFLLVIGLVSAVMGLWLSCRIKKDSFTNWKKSMKETERGNAESVDSPDESVKP